MRQVARWAGLALTLVMVGCQVPTATESSPAAPATAAVAKDVSFIDQSGVKRRLSEFKGRFIVLTEWAEWCPHCQKQLPLIERELYRTYANRGVAFVNVEANVATAEDVQNFAAKLNVTMPLFRDDDRSTQTAYPVQGYPTTTFISPDFKVLETRSGETPIADYITIFKPYLKP
jgi:peroxiredoxin